MPEKPRAPPTASMFRMKTRMISPKPERHDREVVAAQAQRRHADEKPAIAASSAADRAAPTRSSDALARRTPAGTRARARIGSPKVTVK